MRISAAIKKLQQIKKKFGNIAITGGNMSDDIPLSSITVTDTRGMECWPTDPNGLGERASNEIDGVFLQ